MHFKTHSEESLSVADSRSVTGFSVGVLESKLPLLEVLSSSLKTSGEK